MSSVPRKVLWDGDYDPEGQRMDGPSSVETFKAFGVGRTWREISLTSGTDWIETRLLETR